MQMTVAIRGQSKFCILRFMLQLKWDEKVTKKRVSVIRSIGYTEIFQLTRKLRMWRYLLPCKVKLALQNSVSSF